MSAIIFFKMASKIIEFIFLLSVFSLQKESSMRTELLPFPFTQDLQHQEQDLCRVGT